MVGGGRSRHLHVWALDTHKLLRIIELPSKVTQVKQLEFLPDSFDGGANQVCTLYMISALVYCDKDGG